MFKNNRETFDRAKQAINAFDWYETSQGSDYWADVYRNLMALDTTAARMSEQETERPYSSIAERLRALADELGDT